MTQVASQKDAFFSAMHSAGFHSKSKFDELTIDFGNIEGLGNLTTGQKRQLFAEYIAFANKREIEEIRAAKQRSRIEFDELLRSWGEDGELDPDVTFRQIATACHGMDFWPHLDVDELEEIFQGFISSYESKYHNRIRERNHQLKRELFKQLEGRWGGALTPPAWKEVVGTMRDSACFKRLDDLDRFDVFEDFSQELDENRREARRRDAKRQGRKAREAFMHLLELYRDRIMADSEPMKWEQFQPMIRDTPEYVDLIGTKASSQPYDLFAEKRSQWKRDAGGVDDDRKRKSRSGSLDSDSKRAR